MKKVYLLVLLIVITVSGFAQSKSIIAQYGTADDGFTSVVLNRALDVNPKNYAIPKSSTFDPGTEGEVFETETAIVYGWGGAEYFTPTSAVATIAKLIQLGSLSKTMPSLFLTKVAKGKITFAAVNYIGNDKWYYFAVNPVGMKKLEKGAVVYTIGLRTTN